MIQLTVPFNPGDLDVAVYERVRIVSFELDSVAKRIHISCEYGNYSEDDQLWTGGIAPRRNFFIQNHPERIDDNGNVVPGTTEYTDMLLKVPLEGETVYGAAGRELYIWLLTKGHFSGTLVA